MVRALFALFLTLWLGVTVTLAASQETEELTSLKATLYAKIVFLDYEVEKKLVDGKLLFVLLYDTPEALEKAKRFAQAVSHRRVMGHDVVARIVQIGSKPLPQATAYVLFLSDRNLAKEVERLAGKKRLVFVDSPKYLQYGMIALDVGTRVVPVINPLFIKRAGIELRPIIFKVAKVWHDQIQ